MKLTDEQYINLRDAFIQRRIDDMTTQQMEDFVFDMFASMYETFSDEELIDEVNEYDVEITRKVLNS